MYAEKMIVVCTRRLRFASALRAICLAPLLLALLLPAGSAPLYAAESVVSPSQWQVIKREGQGSLLLLKGQKVLVLKGSPYEMGFQHGRLLADETAQNARAYLRERAVAKASLSLVELRKIFDSLRPFIPKNYLEEMRGLADGSGVPLSELQLLHAIPTRFHCTGAAAFGKATADGRLYHTRSLDYSLEIGDAKTIQENAVLIVYQPTEGNAHAVLSWAGLIGCVSGMNVKGISIGEMGNACRDESYSGMPMIIMLREALRRCHTLDDVVEFIRNAPRTCGYTFIVGDGKVPSACALEVSHSRMAVGLPGDEKSSPPPHFPIANAVRRGNHFVDKTMAAIQRDTYDPEISSPETWLAYSVMSGFLLDNYGRLSDLTMIELLRKYPPEHACLHQAVFCPSTLELWVSNAVRPAAAKFAGAQNQPFYKYSLPKLIRGIPFEPEVAEPPRGAADELPRPEAGTVSISEKKEFLSDASLQRFRLRRKAFRWVLTYRSGTERSFVADLSFPSEVQRPWPEVNTVVAEYYRPKVPDTMPAMIVLDILEGNFVVARSIARTLSDNGIAALAVHMPFFGERKPKDNPPLGMLSGSIPLARDIMTQGVLDIRSAGLWLRTRKEIDPNRIGIVGVSLGAVIGGLAIGVDNGFATSALVLGGGDIAEIIWSAPESEQFKRHLLEQGRTLQWLREELRPVDPLTYAHRINPSGLTMFNAERDRTVPTSCTLAFWEKAGQPRILWYNTTHLGMALYTNKVMQQIVDLVRDEGAAASPASVTPSPASSTVPSP